MLIRTSLVAINTFVHNIWFSSSSLKQSAPVWKLSCASQASKFYRTSLCNCDAAHKRSVWHIPPSEFIPHIAAALYVISGTWRRKFLDYWLWILSQEGVTYLCTRRQKQLTKGPKGAPVPQINQESHQIYLVLYNWHTVTNKFGRNGASIYIKSARTRGVWPQSSHQTVIQSSCSRTDQDSALRKMYQRSELQVEVIHPII